MAKRKETRYPVHSPFHHSQPDPATADDEVTYHGCGCKHVRLPDGSWEFRPALMEAPADANAN